MEEDTFQQIAEVESIIDSINSMQDAVLGVYKFEPIKSKKLLNDLEELKNDAGKLQEKFLEIV
jgi:hypothetical protein